MNIRRVGQFAGWSLMTFFALTIAVMSSRYFTLNPDIYFPEQLNVYLRYTGPLMIHISGAVLALVLGPFQFLSALRSRRPGIHRWIGRFYLLGILLGGIGGLFMAFHAYTGWVAGLGFGTLALLWLYTGWMAYSAIRNRNILAHRRWMIRNFALTFAAVTLRLLNPLLIIGFGVDGAVAYQLVAWICWVPNLLVVELWFRYQQQAPVFTPEAGMAA